MSGLSNTIEAPEKKVSKKELVCAIKDLRNEVKALTSKVVGPWMNAKEAATYIRKSVRTVERLKNSIGFTQYGRDNLYHRDDLDRFLQKHYHPPQE